MMMTKTNFALVAALLMICSCTVKNAAHIRKMEWLVGTWEHTTSKGSVYETWQKAERNELRGRSYMIKNEDTIVFEIIRLVQHKGNLFYVPVVKDQNGGAPICFEGKKISETQLVFENKMHDFPQVISYKKISEDSLKAEISGLRNGKEERRHFPMRRIK
ncbi:hypothetical protein SAMN05421664_3007 [Chryseobacterium soldanellicola]|uniref:DUF6265 domain-containing protein n=2 Tax=Chryseobacterium soldanellicola TaxID=311333 RepID=A0A1H1FCZ7_9FLAO|nr:hypothetical protein SAMN05421664_3007 [Chryseobacterium soldanellicola]